MRAQKYLVLPDEDAAEFAALEAALVEETGYGRRPEVEALEAEVPWRAEVMTASVLPARGFRHRETRCSGRLPDRSPFWRGDGFPP